MKETITLMLALTALYPTARTCTCGDYLLDLPIKEMGWTENESDHISSPSDLIFTGSLVDYYPVQEQAMHGLNQESSTQKMELVFKLIKSYKGEKADTIRVRTNIGSDMCGFYAPKGSDCIIFAARAKNGYYFTGRSDCFKSISKVEDEKRYTKYVGFLESILGMRDCQYNFKQSKSYWNGGWPNHADTLDLISYGIKGGKFHGTWKITDRKGRVLESGEYRNGQKVGVWKIFTYTEGDNYGFTQKSERLKYQNGRPIKIKATIKDFEINFEDAAIKAVRTQKTVKKYKYK